MAERTEVYVRTSPEVAEILAYNRVSLAELLRREGIEVAQAYGDDPVRTPGVMHREPITLLILATAATVAAIAPALSRAFGMMTNRPIAAVEKVTEPMLDGAGKPILDEAGKPLLRWIERTQPATLQAHVKGFGIELKVGEHIQARTQ